MWTHPITLLLITSVIGAMAFLVKMILENNKIVYAVSEMVKEMQAEQKVMRKELDELRGEHHMMIKTGDMIGQHEFKIKKNSPIIPKKFPKNLPRSQKR